jgi:hypothetical protein
MIKSVPNWIYYSHKFSRIFPNCLPIFLGQNTEPTGRSPCRRTPRSDWLAWAVPQTRRYKAYLAAPAFKADYALSEAATPVVRAQRHCPRHRTRTTASASRLPVASHRLLPSAGEAEPTTCYTVLHRVVCRELSAPAAALPLAATHLSSPLRASRHSPTPEQLKPPFLSRSSAVAGSYRASSAA